MTTYKNFEAEKTNDRLWDFGMSTEHEKIEIMYLVCLHVGSTHHNKPLWDKYKEWMNAEDNRYMIGLGDYGDFSIPTHIPQTMWAQNKTPREQRTAIIEEFEPFKDKILGLYTGNHELRIWNKTSFDPTEDIADKLGVPHLGIGGIMNMYLNDIHYSFFHIHGERGGMPNHALRQAIEKGWGRETDITVMGHTHSFGSWEQFTMQLNGKPKRQTGIRSASFIKDPDYSFRHIFPYQANGASILTLDTQRKTWSYDNSGEFKFETA